MNGKDLRHVFGVIFQPGATDDFVNFPAAKSSLEHDFPETSGIDKDLSQPVAAAREFSIKCAMIASSRDDFWNKHDGLFTELTTPGVKELYIPDQDRTYYLYYKKMENATKLSQINRDHVGIKFTLVLGELDPFANITKIILVDDQRRYLTT